MPRPPETMILAPVSSGRSDLASFAAHEGRLAEIGGGGDGFDGGRTTGGGGGVEAGAAHGDDLHAVGRLHGGDGVTGVDRALEGVGRIDLGDFRDLGHVQLGGHARQDVLAVGGGRGQDVRVRTGDRQDLLGDVLGQAVGEVRRVGDQHFRDAGDLRGGFGDGAAVAAGDQHVDLAAALGGCGHGVVGAPFSAALSCSAITSATMMFLIR
jgi:hypothetical protein